MKLFKPKAPPPPPPGATYHFGFASDNRNPDGSYKQAAALPELAAAITCVAAEIGRLRAVVDAAKAFRKAAEIHPEIVRARAATDSARAIMERKRMQGQAGIIEIAEVQAANDDWTRCSGRVSALLDELQQREQADAAAAELGRIIEALR